MAQTSEHINSSNQKIHPYYRMRKMIVNLSSKKCKNNNKSTCQLCHLQIFLLMSIVNNPEKDLYNVDWKSDMRKVRTSSVNSSSTLFSCSIYAMYNKVNRALKKRLMLNLYLPGINTPVFQKRHYDNIFYKKLVYELHAWIENHPHVIQSPNVSDSLFVKINGALLEKHNHLLQISL